MIEENNRVPVPTRRKFLAGSAAALTVSSALVRGATALVAPVRLPLGLQLYSVKEMLAADYDGTLRRLAALGYREVEAAGFFGRTAPQVKAAMDGAGLRCVSAHYGWTELAPNLDRIIDYHGKLGAKFIVCSFPAFRDPERAKGLSYQEQLRAFRMDDWLWNAEHFNQVGSVIAKAGLRFAYHNHTMEFTPQGGLVPMVELLRRTDPALVTFELDCGWVTVGGADPAEYLRRYGNRISMLHVKDFKPWLHPPGERLPGEEPPAAEMGLGTEDLRATFAAARQAGGVEHCFVEQEGYDMEPWKALGLDAAYMKAAEI